MVQTEVEIKAHLTSEKQIQRLLEKSDYIGTKIVIDKYFDTLSYDFFQLGIFIRIRNNKTFDIKYNSKNFDLSHLDCQEYNFKYPLSAKDEFYVFNFLKQFSRPKQGESLDIFNKFKLKEFVVIEKERAIYKAESIEIAIDRIQGLGNFIEIEALDSVSDKVLSICRELNLHNIPTGYVELYLRKNNYEVYKKGRYKLSNDK